METAKDFGQLAMKLGFAAPHKVRAARREQIRRRREEGRRIFLAEILLEQSAISWEQLLVILERSGGYRELGDRDDEDVRFGDVTVRKGYTTALQVYRALQEQRDEDAHWAPHRRLGEILLDHGWLAPWEREDVIVTLADLAAGSSRSGDTPSEPIPLRPEHGRRRVVCELPKVARRTSGDVMDAPLVTSAESLLGDALDAAFEVEAEVVLVESRGLVVGFLSVTDLCQNDRGTPVARVFRPILANVSESAPLDEVVDTLGKTGLSCVTVRSKGQIVGVVTRRSLRRAGVWAPQLDEPPIPFDELGVGD
jgi:CBS domain-containing protein